MRLAEQGAEALLVGLGHADARQFQQPAVLQQDAQHRRLAVQRRRDGDAQVGLLGADADVGATVLRQAPLGDVEAGQDLDARN